MKSSVTQVVIFATIIAGLALTGCGQNNAPPAEKPAGLTPVAPASAPGK